MRNLSLSVFASVATSLLILTGFMLFRDLENFSISNEWLGFLGALAGAGLAVWGAIFVERAKQREARAENLNLLADCLEDLSRLLVQIRDAKLKILDLKGILNLPVEQRDSAVGANNNAARALNDAAFTEISDQVAFIDYFVEKQPIGSSKLWSALKRIDRAHAMGMLSIPEPNKIEKLDPNKLYEIGQSVEALFRLMAKPTADALKALNHELGSDRDINQLNWKVLEPSGSNTSD